jgi:hypothetical protein
MKILLTFEVIFLVKNTIFWGVRPCGFSKNRRFGGTYRFHYQSDKNRRARNNVSNTQQPKSTAKTAVFIVTAAKPSNLTH